MGVLQDMIDKTLQEQLDPRLLLVRHVESKLKERGIRLSKARRTQVEEAIQKGIEDGQLSLDFTDREVARATLPDTERRTQRIDLDIDVDGFLQQIEDMVPDIMQATLEGASDIVLTAVLRDAKKNLRTVRKQQAAFERRLQRRWGNSLDLLGVLKGVALEAGSDFNQQVRQGSDYLLYALVRLHARAVHITSEIETLLRTGHADGAHARWRTLHEVTVVAMFLAKHGDETAQRYIEHDAVESKRAALGHQKWAADLGADAPSVDVMAGLQKRVETLAEKYGRSYLTEYGWAAKATGKDKPRFIDLEEDVELDYLRPYYKLASHNVHAGPKGALFRLGLMNDEVLLAGPSNAGLADPLMGTGNALVQVTVSLLTMKPDFDRLVACRILVAINGRLTDSTMKAHNELVKDEEASQAAAGGHRRPDTG